MACCKRSNDCQPQQANGPVICLRRVRNPPNACGQERRGCGCGSRNCWLNCLTCGIYPACFNCVRSSSCCQPRNQCQTQCQPQQQCQPQCQPQQQCQPQYAPQPQYYPQQQQQQAYCIPQQQYAPQPQYIPQPMPQPIPQQIPQPQLISQTIVRPQPHPQPQPPQVIYQHETQLPVSPPSRPLPPISQNVIVETHKVPSSVQVPQQIESSSSASGTSSAATATVPTSMHQVINNPTQSSSQHSNLYNPIVQPNFVPQQQVNFMPQQSYQPQPQFVPQQAYNPAPVYQPSYGAQCQPQQQQQGLNLAPGTILCFQKK